MSKHEPIPSDIEEIASSIIEAAFRVHRTLGPGLLESVYEACLCHELRKMGIEYQRQLALPVVYDGMELEAGLRIDVLVAGQVIVELKAVEEVIPLHTAQLITYLRLTDNRLGLLINFNTKLLKDGMSRIVN